MVITASRKPGVINKKGVLVIDTIYKSIYPFRNNLTIAGDQDGNNMVLLDTAGKRITPPAGIQDANALKAYYEKIPVNERTKGHLIDGRYLVDMGNGITLNVRHGDAYYMDERKYVLWQFAKTADLPHHYDIDYQLMGYYPIKDDPAPVYHCKQALPSGVFSLTVMPDIREAENGFSNAGGYRTILANRSGQAITFNTYDHGLLMRMQAKTNTGDWRDIEDIARGCGNGFSDMTLRSGHYLHLTSPAYSGAIKTKLRLRFTYVSYGRSHTIFSNEFDGSINPGQLWRSEWNFPSTDYLRP
ncbi:WG repeat-containing protein [Chitinophaga pinensis]|uniref:WG repeat-containing protein n=1 Tax=Chitinophaga pinensis TaxID=79329 RepID=A0A5C6LWB4_9BACT|nr:WG repeat-containing protein [Chitinophaga pinensis]TWW00830.1 WG repeat-containing protein [Chitinophaga pinensis]